MTAIVNENEHSWRWADTPISVSLKFILCRTIGGVKMALLSAKDKLMLLVSGKATLKEINELEKQAELEKEEPPKEEPPKEEPPKEEPPKEEPAKDEPDEKDKRIAELEAQLKEAQAENVNGNSDGNEPSFDEVLDTMCKDYRF